MSEALEPENIHELSGDGINMRVTNAAIENEREDVTRDVVVIMSFGSSSPKAERHAILDLMRIKYIVEQCVKVRPEAAASDTPNIQYSVDVFRQKVGRITEEAVDKIAHADVLIALLTKSNANVIYELAVRNLLKDEPILIVKHDLKEELPVYIRSMAFHDYDHKESSRVLEQIESISTSNVPRVTWRNIGKIPDGLKEVIDAHDKDHISDIEEALQKLENSSPRPPQFLRKHVADLDPGRALASWTTFLPVAVYRIKWKRKRGAKYAPQDMIGKPVVYSANEAFFKLFDLQIKEAPDPDERHALSLEELISRQDGYVEEKLYDLFARDQARLMDRIVLNGGFAWAEVPLEFNDEHPFVPNEVWMPVLLGRRRVGAKSAPHSAFLLVAFVKDFYPASELADRLPARYGARGGGVDLAGEVSSGMEGNGSESEARKGGE